MIPNHNHLPYSHEGMGKGVLNGVEKVEKLPSEEEELSELGKKKKRIPLSVSEAASLEK